MFILLLLIAFAEPVANANGNPHALIPGANVGGDGALRLAAIGSYAFLFQCLLLALIVCLSILGISKQHRSLDLYLMMLASFAFMIYVWWHMYAEHQAFLASGTTDYFLGFPIATAWQVYGTWLGGIPLILIYTIGFRKYIYTREDEARFDQLMQQVDEQ